MPRAKLVAVRQIDASGDRESADENYADFVAQVLKLAEASGALGKAGSRH